jgi:hypothetical protein
MDEYAVLVFRDQPFTDAEQIAFAARLDGELHTRTGSRVLSKSRLGNEAVADISNLDDTGGIMQSGDRRRMYSVTGCGIPTPRSRTLRDATPCCPPRWCRRSVPTPSSPNLGCQYDPIAPCIPTSPNQSLT